VFGQTVTFTATVTATGGGTPTGTVTFMDGSTTLGSATLNGSAQATFTTSALAVGNHPITAVYGGGAGFSGSTSPVLTQTVNKDASKSAIVSSANPSVFGQPVTFTVTVTAAAPGSGQPTGTVTFKEGLKPIVTKTLDANGKATLTIATFTTTVHSIYITYSGDGNFLAGNSNVIQQTVNQDPSTTTLTSSVNPSVVGQAVTFTAVVTANPPGGGTATGSVTFKDGTTVLGTVTLNATAKATLTVSNLTVGTHPITAVYGGDGDFLGSTSAVLNQVVNAMAAAALPGLRINLSAFGPPAPLFAAGSGLSGATLPRSDSGFVARFAAGNDSPASLVVITTTGAALPRRISLADPSNSAALEALGQRAVDQLFAAADERLAILISTDWLADVG
jgi:hypothetical protein